MVYEIIFLCFLSLIMAFQKPKYVAINCTKNVIESSCDGLSVSLSLLYEHCQFTEPVLHNLYCNVTYVIFQSAEIWSSYKNK